MNKQDTENRFQKQIDRELQHLTADPLLFEKVLALAQNKKRHAVQGKSKALRYAVLALSILLLLSTILLLPRGKEDFTDPLAAPGEPNGTAVLRVYRPGATEGGPQKGETDYLFMEENKDIILEYVDLPTDHIWDYLSDLKGYDLSIPDIIRVSSDEIDILSAYKKGFLAPISSDKLKNQVQEMYPIVGEYLFYDGKLLGYPDLFYSRWMSVNTELMRMHGLEQPASDLSDWISQMEQWFLYAKNTTEASFDPYSYSIDLEREKAIELAVTLCFQDTREVLFPDMPDLDKPEMISFIERIMSLKTGNSEAGTDTVTNCIYDTWAFDPYHEAYTRALSAYESDMAYIQPIMLDKALEPRYECELIYYIVNPNSMNQEAAEQYLEYIAKNDYSIPVQYALYPISEEAYEYGRKVIPQQAIKQYQDAMPQFSISRYQSLLYAMRWDDVCDLLMEELLTGQITAAQYLSRLEERLCVLLAKYY